MKKFINAIKTNQCDVYVYDTGLTFSNTVIFSIVSIHRASGKINVRFGNYIQTINIIKTYKTEEFKNFHLQNI